MRDKIRFYQSPGWLLTLGLLLLIVITLWLPFGLKTSGLIEEWSTQLQFDRGDTFLHTHLIDSQRSRAFALLSYNIGHLLTPDSFVGLNIVLILLFMGKGLVLYAIVYRLIPKNPALALISATLFIIYPADIGLFELRLLNYHTIVFLCLLAVYFLIEYWRRTNTAILVAMWFSQFVCLATAEAAYALVVASPLLLIWLEKKLNRRVIQIAVLWYCVPLVCLFWSFIIITSPNGTYQSSVLQRFPNQSAAAWVTNKIQMVGQAYYRNLVGGWIDTLGQTESKPSYVYIALLISAATGLAVWLIHPRLTDQESKAVDIRPCIGLLIIGLIVIILGCLVFLLIFSGLGDEETYLSSSAGAALTLATILFLISRFSRWPRATFTALAGMVVGLALLGALNRHLYTVKLILANERILERIVTAVPRPESGTLMLIFDRAHQLRRTPWTFAVSTATYNFTDAIRYIYGDADFQPWLCYPEFSLWGVANEGCVLKDDGVQLYWVGKPLTAYPYNKVIALSYEPSGNIVVLDKFPEKYTQHVSIQNYNPGKLIDSNSPPPPRVHTVFTIWPLNAEAHVNLVRNADFNAGQAQWDVWGEVFAQVNSGVLNFYREVNSPTGAEIIQDLNSSLPDSTPIEVWLELGNSSAVSKQVWVTLRNPDWSDSVSCSFNVAPDTPLRTYGVRGRTHTAWTDVRLEIIPGPADGVPALLMDDVLVQSYPGLNPVGVECLSPTMPTDSHAP